MSDLLSRVNSPADLQQFSNEELTLLAQEMRDELVRVLSIRPAHFASNLGVVELCLALHLSFDFSKDRLIWDTGHQIYPHKLITGRFKQFDTIRTRGGLMGYPNPHESDYDLFMTGHAGCSVSCALGLKTGDDLVGTTRSAGGSPVSAVQSANHLRATLAGPADRHSVAVVGDGALPSGIVFEALNNAGNLGRKLLVILNDNQMSICPRVGTLAQCLDRAPAHELLSVVETHPAKTDRTSAACRRNGQSGYRSGPRRAQGSFDRRHAFRRTRLPLHRPHRRTRPSRNAQTGCKR